MPQEQLNHLRFCYICVSGVLVVGIACCWRLSAAHMAFQPTNSKAKVARLGSLLNAAAIAKRVRCIVGDVR